jgi:IstB-like ATP binding protein
MFAQNIAHQAVIDGHTVLFTSAGQLLGDLCALDSDSALQRRLRHYARPQLLVIDEVGYLSYSNRHAASLSEQKHADHHQPSVWRMERSLSQSGDRRAVHSVVLDGNRRNQSVGRWARWACFSKSTTLSS